MRALLVLLMLLALPPGALAQPAGANHAPTAGPVVSVLAPPFTHYSVTASDPDGDALTFAWSNSNPCGRFVANGAKADWDHGEDTDCGHDSPHHPGVITVRVTDGRGLNATRTYYGGSTSGEGPTPGVAPRCGTSGVQGAFEPAQAVWQDDDVFADKPGKKLLSTDARHHVAELDMVVGKRTALFGVRGERDEVTLRGLLTGTIRAPATLRFTLKDAGGERILYEHAAGELPIEGACGDVQGFAVEVPARLGFPAQAFTFDRAGPYTLAMELWEDGGGPVPGTRVEVEGYARDVHGIRIHVVRATLGAATDVSRDVTRIADELRAHSTDYYPLAPGKVTTTTNGAGVDFERYVSESMARCDDASFRGNLTVERCREVMRRVDIEGYFAAQAWSLGADRVAVVMARATFDMLGGRGAQAFTAHSKVLFARADSDHWDVAHEVAHTLARYPWSDAAMASACTTSYHNQGTFGNGVKVADGAGEARARKDVRPGLMGPVNASKDYWIEQCEYWHLLHALERRPDPPLLAVRGYVLQRGNATGALAPGLSLEGEPDLDANSTGAYALALRDAANATLATYRFDLAFARDDGEYTPAAGFAWRVPDDARARSVALEGPGGVLATRPIAAAPPNVTVTQARVEGGEAVIRWTSSAPGPAWVVVENATGARVAVAAEVEGTEARVPAAVVAGGVTARVLVAADGRAGEGTAPLEGAPPAAQDGAPAPEDGDAGKGAPLGGWVALAALAAGALVARRRGGR